MKLKVIKVQWSYSENLEKNVDTFMKKLVDEGALNTKVQFFSTDAHVGVAIMWEENTMVPLEVATPSGKKK